VNSVIIIGLLPAANNISNAVVTCHRVIIIIIALPYGRSLVSNISNPSNYFKAVLLVKTMLAICTGAFAKNLIHSMCQKVIKTNASVHMGN